ncbi:hypothetical protein RDABS01_028367 [Bienertia sinuspersici]
MYNLVRAVALIAATELSAKGRKGKIKAYCVVAVESAGRQIPIAFLEKFKDEFSKKYGGGKAATAEINKLAKVKAQVSEVKGVMMENIEKVLDRGEKIELVVDKTEPSLPGLRFQDLGLPKSGGKCSGRT